MRIGFVTLFPAMVQEALGHSMMQRAQSRGLIEFAAANPRGFSYDRHHKVDDTPYGGAPGMLIRADPTALALESLIQTEHPEVILTAPTGRPFTQIEARDLSTKKEVIFLCGHYEGFDHRVEQALATRVYSIGDYVLTNGELPALVMADAIARLLPGVLGAEASLDADSHSDGLLSAPNYTRPEEWRGLPIPEILKSGDHKKIARWQREQALKLTRDHRPDLLARAPLEKSDLDMLSS